MMEIKNIWCVARNYADHAKELNNPIPAEPFFFLKAGSCIVLPGETIRLPFFSSQVEYELEIALQFNQDLKVERACLALDLTARDLQKKAKTLGHPWTLAKSFPCSCPIGPFFPATLELPETPFELHVNGQLRQKGNTRDMLFKPRELAAYLKSHYPVRPGDLLLTGTPAGISPAAPKDRVEASIPGLSQASWTIA